MDADGRKEKPHSCWLPCSRRGRRMSHKPESANDQGQKKRKRKKRTKQTITCAVTHIRLIEANPGKLAALDQLLEVYLPLCQQYVALFCTQETLPDKYADPVFATVLSDRLHRVAMQQAAGIAKSWRTNRQAAYDAHVEDLVNWKPAQEQNQDPKRKALHARTIKTSTGKHYGTFHGELAKRHERDREKRRRKAKLRACLKKKGVGKLPPTRA